MTKLTNELISELNVSRESLERLETYVSLLRQWQARINLVGPSTLDNIWSRHIADSLQLLKYIKGERGKIADLGSGAGLPGLVLALASDTQVDLYESNGKKVAFLREVIRQTGINCRVHQIRLENIDSQSAKSVKYVTARALAPLDKLLGWAESFLAQGAIGLFHKGQDVDKELTSAAKSWNMQVIKHPSLVDSAGVILEVKELSRAAL